MFRSMYTASLGMQAQQINMDNVANNLANVNTTGFKQGRISFQDLLYTNMAESSPSSALQPSGFQQIGGIDEEALQGSAQVGTGVRAAATERLFTMGSLQRTDNPLDVVINGDGFFEVTLPDKSKAYTRDGSLKMDKEGRLIAAGGNPIGVKIPKDITNVTIKDDGSIMAVKAGAKSPDPVKIGQISIVRFLNPMGLKPIGENLYRETPVSGAKSKGTPGTSNFGTLVPGHLEKSNINVVEEMMSIIQAQRAYEMNGKVITSTDEMTRMAIQLHRQ